MPPAVPQHCPTPRELDDLELLVTGALRPTVRYDEPGSPVTLSLPPDLDAAARAAGEVELVDPEGLPLARVSVPGGEIEPLTHAQFGPFRRLYLSPTAAREAHAGRTFVPVTDALTVDQIEALRPLGPVALVALVGAGTPALSPVALIRATLRAAELLEDAAVIAVPLASHDDPEADHELGVRVLATYAGPDPVVGIAEAGADDELPDSIAEVVDRDQPPNDRRGLVLFFTGLSGSGKSTLAQALMDRLLERGDRTVTILDGDVVRRNLSAGLTFSREDRETNIRRIGWVAAEISRHGGVAVCSPIAPFDETRQQVRAMADEAGGAFFLVHVATPLEECERRDRKGLYAKARRGEIPEFTGISSPYEEPEDADVVVDTTGRTIEGALDDVIVALRDAGYVDLTDAPVVERGGPPLNVLFVCTANICRSPFMERLARHLAGPDASVVFSGAGTHGFDAQPMDEVMAATLDPRGAAGDGSFASRPLSQELLDAADLVLTAEAAHRTFILDDRPQLFRKVFTLGQFAETIRAIEPEIFGRELVAEAARRRGAADAGLDVRDPYRQGADAAETAAADIERMLRVVVPALTGRREST